MNLRAKKLLSNTGLIAIGTFGSKILVFLLMPLYTSWLTTGEYGASEMIMSVSNFLIPIAAVGVSTGIFRFAAEREANKEAVFSSSVALLGIGLGVFLLLSPLLTLVDHCREYVWLVVLYVILADVHAVFSQYVRAIDRMALFAVQGILNTALVIVFNVVFLYFLKLGVIGYVLSVILGNLVTALFLFFKARLWRVFSFECVQKRLMGEILRFSLPLIPTTLCWLITDLSDRAMVTYFWGEDVNGIYSAAYKIPTIVNLVSTVFLQAWQFSAISESSDEKECSRFYSQVYSGFIAVIMIGTAGLILISRHVTSLLLNPAYHGANEFMPVLLCSVAMEAIVSFLASVYMVRKRSMRSFVTALLGALSNVLLNLLLIPTVGALGAALATLASYAIVMSVRLFDAPRIIRFPRNLPRLALSLALIFASAAAMTLQIPFMYLWALGFTVLTVAINAPALLRCAKALLRHRAA